MQVRLSEKFESEFSVGWNLESQARYQNHCSHHIWEGLDLPSDNTLIRQK